jgi:hypothetical protein
MRSMSHRASRKKREARSLARRQSRAVRPSTVGMAAQGRSCVGAMRRLPRPTQPAGTRHVSRFEDRLRILPRGPPQRQVCRSRVHVLPQRNRLGPSRRRSAKSSRVEPRRRSRRDEVRGLSRSRECGDPERWIRMRLLPCPGARREVRRSMRELPCKHPVDWASEKDRLTRTSNDLFLAEGLAFRGRLQSLSSSEASRRPPLSRLEVRCVHGLPPGRSPG